MECRGIILKGNVKMHRQIAGVAVNVVRSHLSLFLRATEKTGLLGVPFLTLSIAGC